MREGAQIAELTDRIDLSSWSQGTRLICRRERPHPGAQLSVFNQVWLEVSMAVQALLRWAALLA